MDGKPWYQSKTVWVNLVALVGAVGTWAQAGFGMPGLTTIIFPVLLPIANIILRLITKQPIGD
jgi:hypothetical protein